MIKKLLDNCGKEIFIAEFSPKGTLLREENYSVIDNFGGSCRRRWAYVESGRCLFKAGGTEILAEAGTVIEQFQEGRFGLEILEVPLKILNAWVVPEGF